MRRSESEIAERVKVYINVWRREGAPEGRGAQLLADLEGADCEAVLTQRFDAALEQRAPPGRGPP